MSSTMRTVSILITCLTLVACAGAGPSSSTEAPVVTPPSAPTDAPAAAVEVVASAEPSPAPRCATELVAAVADTIQVMATSNIFGAGHDAPPAPAGGGAGTAPPSVDLPAGSRTVTFPHVSGCVTPISHTMPNGIGPADYNGPAGDTGEYGGTNVESVRGISGMTFGGTGMFLAGVFVGDDEPNGAPERLEYAGVGAVADQVEPLLGQTFYVGDGRLPGSDTLREFVPPEGATRLFLGFVDGALYQGEPGFYGNNVGELQVVVDVASE
jgi:hypothetical protein